ncbi:hypothetical protein HMN09_00994300 [Mycena chlorophos]|uniref:BTB domain-containing protein n=1 Tax=Mycena chlorophos TaxID=658473 RepID=A0A8H6SJ98_MYCCL|nr:hypothetical protein HMN09_00994300 [Mycena chlorophos]
MSDNNVCSSGERAVKDEKYYFESGDCTFSVEGVLFKVARLQFCQDPDSAFAHMFEVAQGSPSEPIQLHDSVESFRALCWAMYSPPTQMFHAWNEPESVDLQKYLLIIDIANKYGLADHEIWGWMMARRIANGDAVSKHLKACPEDELEGMMRLGWRCASSAPELIELVESAWLARIRLGVDKGRVSYRRALTVGEDCGRRRFQGDVYGELRRQLIHGSTVMQLGAAAFDHFDLEPYQLDRLLRGHALLSHHTRTVPASAWPAKPRIVPQINAYQPDRLLRGHALLSHHTRTVPAWPARPRTVPQVDASGPTNTQGTQSAFGQSGAFGSAFAQPSFVISPFRPSNWVCYDHNNCQAEWDSLAVGPDWLEKARETRSAPDGVFDVSASTCVETYLNTLAAEWSQRLASRAELAVDISEFFLGPA